MVQMNPPARVGKVSLGFGIAAGIASSAIGVGLIARAESAFGTVWSALFVVLGAVSIIGVVAASRRAHRGHPVLRRSATVTLVLLAAWCATAGVVGTIQENWIWGVLMAFPFAYLIRALRGVARAEAQRRAG